MYLRGTVGYIFLCVLLAGTVKSATGQTSFATNQSNVIDEVVWTIGDEVILRSDIENQKLIFRSEGTLPSSGADCLIAEQMAIQMLLLNQAKTDSITVEQSFVNRYVEAMLKEMVNQAGSEKKLEEYFNKPISQIREDQRRLTMNNEIARTMQSKIVKNTQVTPTEIRSFYSKQKTDSLPYIPATLEIQILRVKPEVSLEQIDIVKKRLLEFSKQINSGEREFSSLARLYSEDQRSAVNGGEFGFVGKGTLESDFSRVVFNMPMGKLVSPIIQTEQGFHIVQLIEKKGDLVNFRHILLRPKVETQLLEDNINKVDSILELIRNKQLTFSSAVDKYSTDPDSKNNSGLMINTDQKSDRYGSSYFTLEELPQEINVKASKLKPGEISNSFTIKDKNGNTEVVAIKLKSFTPGHRANLVDDFQIIKAMALEYKKQQTFDKWIQERLTQTHVTVIPEFRTCTFRYKGWVK